MWILSKFSSPLQFVFMVVFLSFSRKYVKILRLKYFLRLMTKTEEEMLISKCNE
jgi:hypothetical protein